MAVSSESKAWVQDSHPEIEERPKPVVPVWAISSGFKLEAPPEPATERPVAAEPEEEAAPDSQARASTRRVFRHFRQHFRLRLSRPELWRPASKGMHKMTRLSTPSMKRHSAFAHAGLAVLAVCRRHLVRGSLIRLVSSAELVFSEGYAPGKARAQS